LRANQRGGERERQFIITYNITGIDSVCSSGITSLNTFSIATRDNMFVTISITSAFLYTTEAFPALESAEAFLRVDDVWGAG
jgi:hypothetical protein